MRSLLAPRFWAGSDRRAWPGWEAITASVIRMPEGWDDPLAKLCAAVARSPLGTALHGSYGPDGLWIANRTEWSHREDVLNVRRLPGTGKVRFTYHELPTVADRWTRDVEPHEAFGQLERIVRRLHWIVEYHEAGVRDSGENPGS